MIYYLNEEMINSLIYCGYIILVTSLLVVCCCATDKKREANYINHDEPPKYMV